MTKNFFEMRTFQGYKMKCIAQKFFHSILSHSTFHLTPDKKINFSIKKISLYIVRYFEETNCHISLNFIRV